jgi:long-chain fatty acid transport protein
LGILVGLLLSVRAEAAGFALREQSTAAQGNALAGATSGAEDPSYMAFNPAALGWLDGYAVELQGSYLSGHAKLKDAAGTTGAGTPVAGVSSLGDVAGDELAPAGYLMLPVGNRLRFGLGINSPFGLKTDYPDDWVGRYHALDSELETVDINPAVGVRVTDWLSVGAGFRAQYAYGKLTNAVDFGLLGAQAGLPVAPGAADGFARLSGDDWSYGYDLGLLVEPLKGTRLGLAYRSEVDNQLSGRARFTDDAAGVAAGIRATTGLFADTGAKVDVKTPAVLSFGVHQDLGQRFAVMAEAQWTQWSSFDELKVRFDNPAQPDAITKENWHDTWFLALGATWKPLQQLTLRTGIAFDQSPTTDRYRTPRIPDADRYWLSFGLGWQPVRWASIDLGYSHIWVDNSSVGLSATDPGNALRGGLAAKYENGIDVATAGVTLRY